MGIGVWGLGLLDVRSLWVYRFDGCEVFARDLLNPGGGGRGCWAPVWEESAAIWSGVVALAGYSGRGAVAQWYSGAEAVEKGRSQSTATAATAVVCYSDSVLRGATGD